MENGWLDIEYIQFYLFYFVLEYATIMLEIYAIRQVVLLNLTSDNLHYEKFSDGSVKCIEDEIPFELPEGWAWCRVQTIASVKGGKRVPKGYAVTDEKTNHIYIRVTDMKNSTIMLDDLKYISDEVYSQILNYVISKDDIYVTIAGTIGNVGEVPDELDGMNLTENAAKVCNISIDKSFLCKVLSSEFVQKQFRFQTHQVTMAKLALERILDTLIPIAPIDEQTKISRIIDDLSAKIYEIQNSNNNLQALISATKFKILDLAIRGKLVPQDPNDEPSSVLLERIRAEKEELIKQGKIKRDKKESVIFKGDDNSYYQDLPKNWSICSLGDVSEVVTGGTPSKSNKDFYNGSFPFFKPADLEQGENTITPSEYLSDEGKNVSRIIPEQSTLICCIGTIGKSGFVRCECAINQQINAVIPYIEPKYIYYFCNSRFFINELQRNATATTVAIINKSKTAEIPFLLPPITEQKRIVEAIEKIFDTLDDIIN